MAHAVLNSLVDEVESLRQSVSAGLGEKQRAKLGQFLTPAPVARLMARMFGEAPDHVRLLDPGAGVGSLTAATVAELLERSSRPTSISVTAYEIDEQLAEPLHRTLSLCEGACAEHGVQFSSTIKSEDFIEAMVKRRTSDFTATILNPPYFKIAARSAIRDQLRVLGVEVTNIYAAFVAGALDWLNPMGEMVAITPRSFCNGAYFRPFRRHLLDHAAIRQIHVFESRSNTFKDAEVLQENVIFHLVKTVSSPSDKVSLTSSIDAAASVRGCTVPISQVIDPNDRERFLHIDPDESGHLMAATIQALPSTLTHLGIQVSTGPVVDFRAKDYLRAMPDDECVPLIYPTHLSGYAIEWPKPEARKPNAILVGVRTAKLLVPDGNYVLVKRFSAKEERRRVVASVLEGGSLKADRIGLENHLNYFHQNGRGLALDLARGLSLYLNSSAVDMYFRRFSGHTQVNATDLRNIRYPGRADLAKVGKKVTASDFRTQERIDQLASRFLT